eukprot:TRINITY_DN31757_c0_g1_i5.p2 TRINITY_DN31757_c0_g1~~TRINITY_DN31757_c0_g1_i5.p2  ORF type:complete len:129 (+),score=25.68 TRINITY_DN31757_c0_g1_i5:700-1086(+)
MHFRNQMKDVDTESNFSGAAVDHNLAGEATGNAKDGGASKILRGGLSKMRHMWRGKPKRDRLEEPEAELSKEPHDKEGTPVEVATEKEGDSAVTCEAIASTGAVAPVEATPLPGEERRPRKRWEMRVE